jgi:RNA polymerase sigma-70 factor (ECF subfamily)
VGLMTDTSYEVRFRALYAAHRPDVLRYVQRRIDPDLADDVVSEVFLIAWRRFDEMPSAPLPWLYGVARKVLANQRRSKDRLAQLIRRTASDAERTGTFVDLETLVISSAAFAAAFDRLSDDDREVLALVAWEGLGARDIGQVLGCSTTAVGMRVQRARRRLRMQLKIENEEN